MTKTEWLKELPPPEYIAHSEETDRDYIPIGFTEKLLDELCEDDSPWSAEDFIFEITRHDRFYFANSSVVLTVHYDGKTRTVTGAKTFVVAGDDANKDYAGSALSHCINSAATKLGNKFGRSLNGRLDIEKTVIHVEDEISNRPKPDIVALKKYENAIKKKDQKVIDEIESIYNLNTTEAIDIANKKSN